MKGEQEGRSRGGYLRQWTAILMTALLVGGVVLVAPPNGLDLLLGDVVAGGPEPSTSGGPYRFMAVQPGTHGTDDPVTYDPCHRLDVVVNPDGGPADGTGIVREAVAAVSAASGLRMRVVGTTDEAPSRDRPVRDPGRYGRGYSPVLVAWSDAEHFAALAGDTAGVGGSTSVSTRLSGSRHRYVTGSVTLDAEDLRPVLAQPDGHALVRAVVMHELGHVLGLAHVRSEHELMHGDNVGLTELGSGDLAGLRRLGGGC